MCSVQRWLVWVGRVSCCIDTAMARNGWTCCAGDPPIYAGYELTPGQPSTDLDPGRAVVLRAAATHDPQKLLAPKVVAQLDQLST